ncbi:hypothetical protein ACWCXH_35720 [Kitasatospora sp. NPDC001660]
MSKTTAAAPTFASLAHRHGRALAYIAGRDNNPVPADPTSIDDAALVAVVADAAQFLTQAHRDEDAETLELAAAYLADARTAEEADRPVLLRQAEKHLRDSYDMACELADELGDEHDF